MPKPKSSYSRRKQKQRRPNRTPLFLLIGGAIVLLIAAFFVFRKPAPPYVPEVTGGPSLKVDREQIDLGEKKLGSTTAASFTVTNVGDQPLRFAEAPQMEVKEGC